MHKGAFLRLRSPGLDTANTLPCPLAAMRMYRFRDARGQKRVAHVDVLLPCPPRRLADRYWGTQCQSVHLEYKTNIQPRCGAVWVAAEVAVYAHDAHQPRAHRAVDAFWPVAHERERRGGCNDALGTVSGSFSGNVRWGGFG